MSQDETPSSNAPLARVEVPGRTLTAALQRMKKLGRKTPGVACWTLGPRGLTVSWMGMTEVIEGAVVGEAMMVIPGDLMRGVAGISDWPEVVAVVAREGSLAIGRMTFGAERRAEPVPRLLPLNSTPRDLVQLHVRETEARIEQAGLTSDVAQAMAKLDESCERAQASLGWLGVSAEDVRAWILGRMARRVEVPEPTVLVVETSGQIRLFDT